MQYKRLIPCIFIQEGKAVKWFDNMEVVSDNVIALAKYYYKKGADELLLFDLSKNDEDHVEAVQLMQKISRAIQIPTIVGGNITTPEDVGQYLLTGAKRVMLNLSKQSALEMLEQVSEEYGKEHIAVSLNDFDALFKQQHLIDECVSEIVFMHRLDLNSVVNITELPCIIVTDTLEEDELISILKSRGVRGISGRYISLKSVDIGAFKEKCASVEIKMSAFESQMEFTEFDTGSDGVIPVIIQNYKTTEVLMLEYMNKEAFEQTIKTGQMTLYDKNTKQIYIQGENSGHFQFVKSMQLNCEKNVLLAKVDQIGPACKTGKPSCFYQPIVGREYDETNPLQVFESVYNAILDQKENPTEGSYTNYLFEKGIDQILQKLGDEAVEMIIAAKNPNPEQVRGEMADFLYASMVLMVEKGLTWEDVIRELEQR